MAIDTLMAYVGVYGNVDDAEADYDARQGPAHRGGPDRAYDAAVIERRDKGKAKIVKKHETPTGSAACSAAAWAWRPGSSSRCSRSPRSVAGCSPPRRPAARSSARSRATPRRG